MHVIPSFFKDLIISSKFMLSLSFKEAVGSSNIKSSTFFASAFDISTNCCFPTPIEFIGSVTFSFSKPTTFNISIALSLVLFQSITPFKETCSFPKNIFSAIDKYGIKANSCCIITMPSCSLSFMFLNLHFLFL